MMEIDLGRSRRWRGYGSIALFFIVCLAAAAVAAQDGAKVPWALRDHYSFSRGATTFHFDVKTTEWKIDVQGLGAVVDDVGAEVHLGDGRVLCLSDLEYSRDEREKFKGPLGKGTYYRSIFQPRDGLAVRHAVARFSTRSFLMLYLDIENTGSSPIEIAAIRPAVIGPDGIRNLGEGARVVQTHTANRGPFPVVHGGSHASLVRFELEQPKVTLALGVLQSGQIESRIELSSHRGAWQGYVECRFDPPVRLEPGARLEADPIWVSFAVSDPAQVQQVYSWAQSTVSRPKQRPSAPASWVTSEDGVSAEELYKAARHWAGTGVNHVLAPGTWEGRPGSLHGATPLYPRDMRGVVREIEALRMRPGITVDPLSVVGGDRAWTVLSEDGTSWLDVSNPEARQYGVARMHKVVEWGFQFFVVQPSLVPGKVLRHFGLTRAQADSAALEIVRKAAEGLPVFPSHALTLRNDVQRWREAADATGWLVEYGVVLGPVRFDVAGLAQVGDELGQAVSRFNGPIEFIGQPKAKVRRQLGEVVGARQNNPWHPSVSPPKNTGAAHPKNPGAAYPKNPGPAHPKNPGVSHP